MAMLKVIYFYYLPLTKKLEDDFYLKELNNNGVNTEYWDITNLYFRDLKIPDTINRSYIRYFDNLKQFNDAVGEEEINNTIFIPLISWGWREVKIFRVLTRHKCRIYSYCGGLLPNYSRRTLETIISNLNIHLFKKTLRCELQRLATLYLKLGIIKRPDAVFTMGRMAALLQEKGSKIIPINHSDYDRYMSVRDKTERLIGCRYCVFLDDYMAHHVDLRICNVKPIDPAKYYDSLNKFFDAIEGRFLVKVVISAHPKSDYKDNYFGGRKIYISKTNELAKDCEFAITSVSTSINYPILYKKPIVLYYTDDIKKKFAIISSHTQTITMARVLDCSIYNIDHISGKDITVKNVNAEKYDAWKYTFLTSRESENRRSADIVVDCLKNLKPT